MESDNKYSIFRNTSDDDDEIYDTVDWEKEEVLLARRRCLKLTSMISVFIISFSLLAMSVLYDVHAGDIPDEDGQQDLFCPLGMSWSSTMSKCMAEQGYSCCPTCSQEYRCSMVKEEKKCCHLLGIMPSTFKLMCRPGWVWVEWGQRCVRVEINSG